MTTRLYLVRHAEAEGNLYRRIHGWYDALITDNGYRQIAALEGRFADIPIDAVYSSDLFRTKTTASAVWRPKKLPLTTIKGLREIGMGIWEDRTWGEVARTDGARLLGFNATDPDWSVEGGETFQDLRGRMERSLRGIAARHPGETVAVFSHGTAIRNALAVFHGMTVAESAALGHSDNTAVSLLEFEGDKVRVVFENDNSHLPEEISTLARQNWWKDQGRSLDQTNLWFRPLDVTGEEAEFYFESRREAWQSIHHTMEHFDGQGFLEQARRSAKKDPRSVMCAMLKEERVGLIQMDFEQDAEKGVGYIPFCYMGPDARKKGFGVQLLGQAVSTYRPMGRDYLRLRCAPDNDVAQRFYQRYGFRKIGKAPGTRVPLDMMEKFIGYKDMRE